MGITDFMKKNTVQAVLVGAFGGMAPKGIEVISQLFKDLFPSSQCLLGLVLLGVIGAIIVMVYGEKSLQRALMLGAGAPAIFGTLTAHVANPDAPSSSFLFDVHIVSTAYAQPITGTDTVKFVIKENASPYQLNALWIRSDSQTIKQYLQVGDTLFVPIPRNSAQIRINLPGEGQGFVISTSEVLGRKQIYLRISDEKGARDFWKTFGNVNLQRYKISIIDSK